MQLFENDGWVKSSATFKDNDSALAWTNWTKRYPSIHLCQENQNPNGIQIVLEELFLGSDKDPLYKVSLQAKTVFGQWVDFSFHNLHKEDLFPPAPSVLGSTLDRYCYRLISLWEHENLYGDLMRDPVGFSIEEGWKNYKQAIDNAVTQILNYDSDTFCARQAVMTRYEAHLVLGRLIENLIFDLDEILDRLSTASCYRKN